MELCLRFCATGLYVLSEQPSMMAFRLGLFALAKKLIYHRNIVMNATEIEICKTYQMCDVEIHLSSHTWMHDTDAASGGFSHAISDCYKSFSARI